MKVSRTINFLLRWSSASGVKLVLGLSCLLLLLSITNGSPVTPSNDALRHGIRLQPELDKIDIDAYLKNTKALKIQVQCLIYDGPCDWVGRWLKPRAAAALLGECLLCTEHQKGQLQKIMDFIQVTFPEEFKIGIKKYLAEYGIQVPQDGSSSSTTTTTPTTTTTMTVVTTTTAKSEATEELKSSSRNSTTLPI